MSLYYVFSPEIRDWRNRLLYAELQGNLPTFQPHWWLGEKFSIPLPTMTFAVPAKAPHPDNYYTATNVVDLYSAKLISLLQAAGVQSETAATNIVDLKTKSPLPLDYSAFHLVEIFPFWNKELSEVDQNYRIKRIVLTKECLASEKPFFRLDELYITLIHENLKKDLEEAGVTGCKYIAVEEYRHTQFNTL